jgi:hemolysin III
MILMSSFQEKTIIEQMTDGGPIYQETDLARMIVEPWNAFSSLLYLIPVIYFLVKLKGHYRDHAFLIWFCSPLLAIGGMGSALFHGFRIHPFFMYMDFVPIAVLTLGISIYFWVKILPKWWYVLIIVALSMVLRFAGFAITEGQAAINLSYFNTGLMIFIPALVYVFRTRFCGVRYFVWSLLLLGVSLLFRIIDDWNLSFPAMGTHWLWHLFSAAGALALGKYLVKNNH